MSAARSQALISTPDFRFDCGEYQVIIEVDEFAHRRGTYDPRSERERMKAISAKLGLPCVFIRYNPDGTAGAPEPELTLLERLIEYTDYGPENIVLDDDGLAVCYLFY